MATGAAWFHVTVMHVTVTSNFIISKQTTVATKLQALRAVRVDRLRTCEHSPRIARAPVPSHAVCARTKGRMLLCGRRSANFPVPVPRPLSQAPLPTVAALVAARLGSSQLRSTQRGCTELNSAQLGNMQQLGTRLASTQLSTSHPGSR